MTATQEAAEEPIAASLDGTRGQPEHAASARDRHRVGATPRPANLESLERMLDRRLRPFKRAMTRLQDVHPAMAVLAVLVTCYLLLVLTLIGSGLLFTHVMAHSRVGHWDDHVSAWFAHHRTKTWNGVSADFTLLADTVGVTAVAGLVTVVLLVRRWGRVAMLLVIGLLVELAVFVPTTYVVARPRPRVPHVGSTPSTYSWPSGHTAATLVLYGGMAVLVMAATRRRFLSIVAWIVSVSLTLCVALSRIYRGEHHPIDTLAGAALGIGALSAAVLVVYTWGAFGADRRPVTEPSSTGLAQPTAASVAVRR